MSWRLPDRRTSDVNELLLPITYAAVQLVDAGATLLSVEIRAEQIRGLRQPAQERMATRRLDKPILRHEAVRLGTGVVVPYAGRMARYLIDAPTLLHLVDSGQRIDASHQLVAPNWIRSEALQLLLRDVRRGERADRAALEAHERITALKMRLLGDRVSRGTAWRIARQEDWDTLRDAEYLAIAQLQADALVTVDPGLAAKAENIVPVAPLQTLLASY